MPLPDYIYDDETSLLEDANGGDDSMDMDEQDTSYASMGAGRKTVGKAPQGRLPVPASGGRAGSKGPTTTAGPGGAGGVGARPPSTAGKQAGVAPRVAPSPATSMLQQPRARVPVSGAAAGGAGSRIPAPTGSVAKPGLRQPVVSSGYGVGGNIDIDAVSAGLGMAPASSLAEVEEDDIESFSSPTAANPRSSTGSSPRRGWGYRGLDAVTGPAESKYDEDEDGDTGMATPGGRGGDGRMDDDTRPTPPVGGAIHGRGPAPAPADGGWGRRRLEIDEDGDDVMTSSPRYGHHAAPPPPAAHHPGYDAYDVPPEEVYRGESTSPSRAGRYERDYTFGSTATTITAAEVDDYDDMDGEESPSYPPPPPPRAPAVPVQGRKDSPMASSADVGRPIPATGPRSPVAYPRSSPTGRFVPASPETSGRAILSSVVGAHKQVLQWEDKLRATELTTAVSMLLDDRLPPSITDPVSQLGDAVLDYISPQDLPTYVAILEQGYRKRVEVLDHLRTRIEACKARMTGESDPIAFVPVSTASVSLAGIAAARGTPPRSHHTGRITSPPPPVPSYSGPYTEL